MDYIKYEFSGHIGIVTVSREKALNALNTQVMQELERVIDSVQADKDVYCLIITGAGDKSFVAGADVGEMKDMDVEQGAKFGADGNRVFRKIETLRMPVIAAVNGYALGGGLELALACDIRIASNNALFGFPETGLGITPGYGGTQRLPRLISVSAAKEMIFSGKKVVAAEACTLGIVSDVTEPGALMDTAKKLAAKIARQAPIAVANAKAAVNKGLDCDMDTALSIETQMFSQCFETQDQKNGMNVFVNKEKLNGFENK